MQKVFVIRWDSIVHATFSTQELAEKYVANQRNPGEFSVTPSEVDRLVAETYPMVYVIMGEVTGLPVAVYHNRDEADRHASQSINLRVRPARLRD